MCILKLSSMIVRCLSFVFQFNNKNFNKEISTKYGGRDIWGMEQNLKWHISDDVKTSKDKFTQVIQIGGDIGC